LADRTGICRHLRFGNFSEGKESEENENANEHVGVAPKRY